MRLRYLPEWYLNSSKYEKLIFLLIVHRIVGEFFYMILRVMLHSFPTSRARAVSGYRRFGQVEELLVMLPPAIIFHLYTRVLCFAADGTRFQVILGSSKGEGRMQPKPSNHYVTASPLPLSLFSFLPSLTKHCTPLSLARSRGCSLFLSIFHACAFDKSSPHPHPFPILIGFLYARCRHE